MTVGRFRFVGLREIVDIEFEFAALGIGVFDRHLIRPRRDGGAGTDSQPGPSSGRLRLFEQLADECGGGRKL